MFIPCRAVLPRLPLQRLPRHPLQPPLLRHRLRRHRDLHPHRGLHRRQGRVLRRHRGRSTQLAAITDLLTKETVGWIFGGAVFRLRDNGGSWTTVNNGLACGNTHRRRSIQRANFAATAGCGEDVYHSTDNGDSRTLADTGLTSTETAELGIDNSGHLFAALVL